MPRKATRQPKKKANDKLADLVKILKRNPQATLSDVNKNRRGKNRYGPRTLGKARTLAGITTTPKKTEGANRRRQKTSNTSATNALATLRAELARYRRIVNVLEAAEKELAAEA